MRVTVLVLGLLAAPAAAQVTPSAVTGPPSLSPWTGPIFPERLSRDKHAVRNLDFRREAATLQRDMAAAQGDGNRLSPADRAVFEQRYTALLQRYGYPVPRFK